MSSDTATNPFSRRVVLQLSGADEATVQADLPWGDGDDRVMDIYHPALAADGPSGAVIFVTGFSDPGFRSMTGHRMKDTAPYVSWARLVAASGLVAITYANREPVADAAAILRHVEDNAETLGIDVERLGIWACSGNVPNALALLAGGSQTHIRCASLCYGYMLDLDGATAVADASRQWKFAAPSITPSAIPVDMPILIARAGRDEMPGLNASIDDFQTFAASAGLDVHPLGHPTGPHAFDIMDDSETSRQVVSDILDFLRKHLLVA